MSPIFFSATHGDAAKEALFSAQLRWFVICAGLMAAIYVINYHFYEASAYWFYIIAAVLLALTLIVGFTSKGSARWLGIGIIRFQPSELSKIALVLALARYFAQHPKSGGYTLKDIAIPFGMLVVPTILIMAEPDLGTAILHVLLFGSMVLFVGIDRRTIFGLGALGAVVAPIAWFFRTQGLPARTYSHAFQPRARSARRGIPHQTVVDRRRKRPRLRQRLSPRHANQTAIPSRNAHRLRFFSPRRRMGAFSVALSF
ncbi:MAG: FtsW/RodA/SpoVE family cell cycle protein [Deltaproteobacteria bacterium]|nr:FtsW/RodA/SpoVE family cell cycle protein [Deltaproteobacteria bacterium]